MKAVFISPYLKQLHTGGGEKHLFDVALCLPKRIQVEIALPTEADVSNEDFEIIANRYLEEYQLFLGRSLKRVRFIRSPLFTQAPWYTKLWWTRNFDYLYYVTDGSLFFSLAKYNFLHIQTPIRHNQPSFLQSIKLKQWHSVNTNSQFTKHVVEKSWGLTVNQVLYPAIDPFLTQIRTEKQNLILAVGRFFPQLHSKRQDILVEAFRQLLQAQPRLLKDWELVFVGTIENQAFFSQIKASAHGLPIRFETSMNHQELLQLYAQSRLFWHATGFGIDQTQFPEKVEHFGIATVEAMAAGVIPLIIASGGQTEVIPDELRPYCWNTISELVTNTIQLLRDPGKESQLRKIIRLRALDFSEIQLEKNVRKLFNV